mmetsp:Transcript_20740/g.49285  ORF Transcript_20740/g.49285 Transcript_20740/m.49285 type:complete len:93 (+) Transcript_20740:1122-1400(+)
MHDMNSPFITQIRGRGLLNAFVIDESKGVAAWDICMELKQRGLLCKPTHDNIIRLAPPLVITEAEIDECITIIQTTLEDFAAGRVKPTPSQH